MNTNFEIIWNSILAHSGEVFHTKTGLPFTYNIVDNCVIPDRTNYPLDISNFKKAADLPQMEGPGQISNLVRGPSYVFAILTDERIK